MSSPVCYRLSASQLFFTRVIWASLSEIFKMTSKSSLCSRSLLLLSTAGT
jgi:hypothetical protein